MKCIKILLVDDDFARQLEYLESMKLGLSRYLKRRDFEVEIVSASNEHEAYSVFDETVSIVITDLCLWASHGQELDTGGNCIIARANRLQVPAIGMSSEPEKFVGTNYVFKKPIDLIQLADKVIEILKERD